jgi:hypothetical protein
VINFKAPWKGIQTMSKKMFRHPWVDKIKTYLFLALFALVIFAYAFISADGSVCDTPFGARDLRCVGHFR